jgi:hypothetical protein
MAEREGFEPSVRIFSLRRFSKPLPSATRPPLHDQLLGVCPQAGRVVSAVTSLTSGLILPQPVQEVQVKGLGRRVKSLAGSCGASGVPLKTLDVTSGFGEKAEGCRTEMMRKLSRLGRV